MKKIVLFLMAMLACGRAWATPDWAESTDYTVSQQINKGNAAICQVTVSGIGVTAGDFIQLSDANNNAAGSVVRLTVSAPTANFTQSVSYGPNPCNLFTTGVYLKVSTTSGTMHTAIQYLNAI